MFVCIYMCMCMHAEGPEASNWPSEHALFDQCEAQSMNSVQSVDRPADRSADNIIQLRSRVSSQENGECERLVRRGVTYSNMVHTLTVWGYYVVM